VKISFRIECPYCNWGHNWSNNYVNQGWLALECFHCGKQFYNKITITGVNIETTKELPVDVPCHNRGNKL
jgi:DNA-directed RNA polymerase subunit RPC12/RpoP